MGRIKQPYLVTFKHNRKLEEFSDIFLELLAFTKFIFYSKTVTINSMETSENHFGIKKP